MRVGDTVEYKGKEYYLYSLYKDNLCRIVRLRDGKYTHTKGGVEHLNANIVNLDIREVKEITNGATDKEKDTGSTS